MLDDIRRENLSAREERHRSTHASRDGLDRAEREIKDEVLRMGSLVAAADRGAIGALAEHDADAATAVIVG